MLRKLLLPTLGFFCTASALAQTAPGPTRIYGLNDKDVPTPVHSKKAQSDGTGIQALIDFVKATGLTEWKGAVATGTMTFAGDTVAHAAKLSMLGGDNFRLDVTRDAGTESTIYQGARGIFIAAGGARSSVSSDIASLGLLSFPRLLTASYPQKSTLIADGGAVTIGGATLHRITLDDAATDVDGNPWKTVDLYFEPKSGRLIENVATVHLSTADAALYTLETTYSDYRKVGPLALPQTYTQSLNGQLLWTLTLDTLDTSTLPDASLFNF